MSLLTHASYLSANARVEAFSSAASSSGDSVATIVVTACAPKSRVFSSRRGHAPSVRAGIYVIWGGYD